MKNRNWFWGILFILAAASVIAIQTGSFGQISVQNIVVGILLGALMIDSLIRLNYFGIFLPAALLYMAFWQPLGLPEISPWMLLLSAILTSTGFSILFHKGSKEKKHWHEESCKDCTDTETIDDNKPYVKVQFGSSSKYLHADCLQSGKFISSFGELEVFFDQVQLSPEGAEVFLDCSFGVIKLNIPKQWRVIDNVHVSLGEFKNNPRMSNTAEDAPRITLSGSVQFGGIEIQYI